MGNLLNRVVIKLTLIKTQLWYKLFFKHIGKNTIIHKPLLLQGVKSVIIGERCNFQKNVRLEVITSINTNAMLLIGDNVNIEQNVHLVCGKLIKIGNNVSITANCAIVDISHPYADIDNNVKVGARLDCSQSLEIGDNSFIGIGSIVLPGANIGKYCIIGSNSVVTKSIPDYCIAVGNPARVIKKYDFEKKEWIMV